MSPAQSASTHGKDPKNTAANNMDPKNTRRKNTAQKNLRGVLRNPGWVRPVIALVILAVVITASALVSAHLFGVAKAKRIAVEHSDTIRVETIYDDRVESQYDADYDRAKYRTMATSLTRDSIYIDDYAAFGLDDSGLDTLARSLVDLPVPVYVAFVTTSDLDDTDGDTGLLAARIVRELPDAKATVLVKGPVTLDTVDKGISRTGLERPEFDPEWSAVDEVNAEVAALKNTEVEEDSDGDPTAGYSDDFDVVNEDDRQKPEDLQYAGTSVSGAVALGIVVGAILGAGALVAMAFRPRLGRRPMTGSTRMSTPKKTSTRKKQP